MYDQFILALLSALGFLILWVNYKDDQTAEEERSSE